LSHVGVQCQLPTPSLSACCNARAVAAVAVAAVAFAAAGKDAAEGAAEVFKEMASQAGLQLQHIPVVDGQLDL
jgi:hypothetical protein